MIDCKSMLDLQCEWTMRYRRPYAAYAATTTLLLNLIILNELHSSCK
jgi:hypothetical protein